MEQEELQRRVRKLLVEHLGVADDKVTDDARLTDDLGADSLDLVELTMALEEEFGIEITDEDAEKHFVHGGTVGDVEHYLSGRLA